MESKKGTLYLFSGLSGAGKTTLGGLFFQKLRERKDDVFIFDNDAIKWVFLDDGYGGYDRESRVRRAYRSLRLCKAVTDQGIDVVCCIIAVFDELTAWARENIDNFREIYVKVSMETLRARDQKGLYSSNAPDVVGVDVPYDEPSAPDVVALNEGVRTPEELVAEIMRELGL